MDADVLLGPDAAAGNANHADIFHKQCPLVN